MDQPQLTQLTLNPTTTIGQTEDVTGTVTLTGPAPAPDGLVVELFTSSASVAEVKPSVTVPQNATSATFKVTAQPVAKKTSPPVQIVASTPESEKLATLTVQPPEPDSFGFSPPSIEGGEQSRATITLSGPAPSETSLRLSGSPLNTASFRERVKVDDNAKEVTFTATGKVFSGEDRSVEIIASYLGVTRKACLTVEGTLALSSVDLNPTTVVGQTEDVTGTVTLTGPAPAGGMSVSLSSPYTDIVSVPPSVGIVAGSNTARFSMKTKPVSSRTLVTVIALSQGVERRAILTVQPPRPQSVEFVPNHLLGIPIVESKGTITLNGPAPSGTLINLTASLSAPPPGATVAGTLREPIFPVNLPVQAGATQISFDAMMEIFQGPTRTVTITASYLGAAANGQLRVDPGP